MGKFFILVTVLGFLNILGNLAYTMSLVAYKIYNTYFVTVHDDVRNNVADYGKIFKKSTRPKRDFKVLIA